MNDFKKKGIYFLPLGGADEIGMNMFVYAANGKLIVVDAGYGFLNDDFPGMDMCYASPEFLEITAMIFWGCLSPTGMKTISAPSPKYGLRCNAPCTAPIFHWVW